MFDWMERTISQKNLRISLAYLPFSRVWFVHFNDLDTQQLTKEPMQFVVKLTAELNYSNAT